LHEGRRQGVLGSGCVSALTGANAQTVRCLLGCHRKCPTDLSRPVKDEKKQVLLKVVKQCVDRVDRHLYPPRDIFRAQWLSMVTGQFRDGEVADAVVLRGHEIKSPRGVMLRMFEVLKPLFGGQFEDSVLPPD
jgi:hypothetical protein